SASRYLIVDGYGLVNLRAGFRWSEGWSLFVWSRNLLDKQYYELLSAQPGNSGLYVGLPGDPRTVGVTLRTALGKESRSPQTWRVLRVCSRPRHDVADVVRR